MEVRKVLGEAEMKDKKLDMLRATVSMLCDNL